MNIEFKIGKQEWKIKEVTIRDYYRIQTLLAAQGFDAKVQIVSQLSECPLNDLKRLDKHQFNAIWNALIEGPLDVSETAPFHRTIVLNEKLYGFFDINQVTVGEYSDLEVLRAMPDAQQQLHKMMAIMYRPAKQITKDWHTIEPYSAEGWQQRADEFLDLPLIVVYGALNFFLSIQDYLLKNTLDSLMKQMTVKEEKEMLNLTKQLILELPGIGKNSSSLQLQTTLQKLNRLKKLASQVSSTTSHTEKTNTRKKSYIVKRWLNKIKHSIK